MSAVAGISIGNLGVHLTNGRTRTAEELSALCTRRLVSISANSHPLLHEQAQAFKGSVQALITYYINEAIEERRSRDAWLAENAGRADVAEAIRKDK